MAERAGSARIGWSLATQLALWFAGGASVIVGLSLAVMCWALADHLHRRIGEILLDKVQVLRSDLASKRNAETLLRHAAIGDAEARVFVRLYIRLLDARGQEIIATPGFDALMPATSFPALVAGTAQAADLGRLRGADGGLYCTATARAEIKPGDSGVLQIAYANADDQALLAYYRAWMIGVGIASLSLCALASYHLTRRAVRPLHRIIDAANAIGTERLDLRVPITNLPHELVLLARDFNGMLDRLAESFERLKRFSSDIAHELRTPVHNLQCMAEVALNAERSPEQYKEVMISCLEECHRLGMLIDSLLFLAKAEDPKAPIQVEDLDLAQELDLLERFYRLMAEETGVELTISASIGRLPLRGDRSLIHRAVGNLIENAFEYTPRGGRIDISAARRDGFAEIVVADTGCGIESEHLPHVFDRLYRAQPGRIRSHHVGIGLAIVQSIARLHGGSVEISSAVGKGTTVRMILGSREDEIARSRIG